jgi:hypothetical protein
MKQMRLWVAALGVAALALCAVGTASAASGAPVNTAGPTITGTAVQGQQLSATSGTWTGTTPIRYGYQWQACDQNGANCADIAGAATPQYIIQSAVAGKTLRVVVTATNASGSATAASLPTGLVNGTAVTKITLNVSKTLVVYDAQTHLYGTAAGAAPNQTVTIYGHTYPFNASRQLVPVAKVQTDSSGNFQLMVSPKLNTVYYAQVGTIRSQTIGVNVRPKLVVERVGKHLFVVRAQLQSPLTKTWLLVQRFDSGRHIWVSYERLYLRGSLSHARAVLALPKLGGSMVRLLLPLKGAAPAYVSATSKAFTA